MGAVSGPRPATAWAMATASPRWVRCIFPIRWASYEKITEYLGFLHSSDEYKVMALASFGRPRYLKAFHEIISPGSEGQYTIGPLCLEERFGLPRRRGEP